MTFFDLFKRRNIGPLSVSPVGLAVFCLFAAAAGVIANGVFEDKEIQNHIYAAKNYAYPIAAPARLMQEQTGKFPGALAEIATAKAKAPPQVGRTQLLKDGEVRVVFASPPSIVNSTLALKVIVRDGEHFLECHGEGAFKGALPSVCRPGAELQRMTWPPEMSGPAGK